MLENRTDLDAYLRMLYGDDLEGSFVELRAIEPDRQRPPARRFAGRLEDVSRTIRELQREHDAWNVFNGLATRRERGRGGKRDLAWTRVLWVDLDCYGDDPEEAASFAVSVLGIPSPSMMIASGGGAHLYWFLRHPLSLRQEEPGNQVHRLEAILKGLAFIGDGDMAATDASRILRPPGTVNHPNKEKIAAGRAEAPVKLLHLDDRMLYTLEDFEEAQGFGAKILARSTVEPTYERKESDEDELPIRVQEVLEVDSSARGRYRGDASELNDESDSGVDMSLATLLAMHRVSGWEIESALKLSRIERGAHKQPVEKGDDYFIRTVCKALASAGHSLTDACDHFDAVKPSRRDAFRFLDPAEFIDTIKPAEPILDGLLYRNGVVIVFGKWGLGKTYVVLDLLLAVSHGFEKWQGRPLRIDGPCAFLALEGEYALTNRLRAWQRHHSIDWSRNQLFIYPGAADLRNQSHQIQILEELRAINPVLVAIDTLAAAAPGADENASKDMGPVVAFARQIYRETNATVILIHHPPKHDSSTARGSSVLEANTDGVLQITEQDGGFALKGKKVRAAKPAAPLLLRLKEVVLGEDPSRGVPISDAVVIPNDSAMQNETARISGLVKNAAERLGWPVRLRDIVEQVAEESGCGRTKARSRIEAAIPATSADAPNMWGLWRERPSQASNAPWLIKHAVDSGSDRSA